MNSTNETREQILDTAQDLLQRRSIAGISFQELANQVGIKKGSMYYHFESKDSLTVALLDRAREQFLRAMQEIAQRSPPYRLEFYFGIFGKHFGAGNKMCPGGSFAAVWGTQSDEVKAAAQRLMQAHLRELEKIMAVARTQALLNEGLGSDEELALWIAATLQGAMTMARIMSTPAGFMPTVSLLQRSIFRSEPGTDHS